MRTHLLQELHHNHFEIARRKEVSNVQGGIAEREAILPRLSLNF
jgi:hypothetical protein